MPLPTELYEQILHDVDKSDLKNCRLASRHLSLCVTPVLFRKLRLSLSMSSCKALENIASSENLRYHVRIIVWDDRQLPERWLKRINDEKCPLARKLCPLSSSHKQILAEVYKKLYLEQEWIWREEHPKDVLVTNIHRFPHLDKLILTDLEPNDNFHAQPVSKLLSSGLLRHHSTWALPSHTPRKGYLTPGDILGYLTLTQALSGPPNEYFQNKPIHPIPSAPYTTVKTLEITTDIFHAHAIFLLKLPHCETPIYPFYFLEKIVFHIHAATEEEARLRVSIPTLLPRGMWAFDMLNFARMLRQLHFDFSLPTNFVPVRCWPTISLKDCSFPDLQSLSLTYVRLYENDLVTFFRGHRLKLRRVHLRKVYLRREGKWRSVFEKLRKANIEWGEASLVDLLDMTTREKFREGFMNIDVTETVMRYLRRESARNPYEEWEEDKANFYLGMDQYDQDEEDEEDEEEEDEEDEEEEDE
jgi:hypothetical protein